MLDGLGQGLAGGVLIGLAAGLYMLVNGRIFGVSGMAARPLGSPETVLALLGIPLGMGVYLGVGGAVQVSLPSSGLLALAGLLVGFGSRMGGGCTSGHAVCGLARLSPRSLASTAVFMATAMLVVFVTRRL